MEQASGKLEESKKKHHNKIQNLFKDDAAAWDAFKSGNESAFICIGNSTGGTISYFASAVEERIKLAVVSCSFSTYESSWLKYPHCSCGYLPGVLEVGDMPDFAQLIAPRDLIIVAGVNGHLADIEGVRRGYEIAKEAYAEGDNLANLQLIEGDGGHQFYPDLAWPEINKRKE